MLDWFLHLLPVSYTDAVVLTGSAVIGILAGLVGCLAVLSRRSMLGDATSHAALPGVCIAFLLIGGTKDPVALLIGALVTGAIAVATVVLLQRLPRVSADGAIGVVLSVSFSLGIVLLTLIARRPDADQAGLDQYLFGQAASLLIEDVRLMFIMAIPAALILLLGIRIVQASLFDASFARSVGVPTTAVDVLSMFLLVAAAVTGLQVVGAILMVALLVAPALAARQWTRSLHTMLPLAAVLGGTMGVLGAALAARTETPTGPMVVLAATTITGISLLVAPNRGVVAQARSRRRARRAGALA
ncbi:MAG: hypothetical protein JWO69_96 [Thermoleophilia bacterium]|nr:hypothetical protein [Thermoleophilia bacterium]